MTRKVFARLVAILAGSLVASGSLRAETVSLRLVDQNASEIAGSAFSIEGSTISTGGSASLAPGTYTITVYPGFGGHNQTTSLWRTETLTVTEGMTESTLEWVVRDVEIDVREDASDPATRVNGSWVRVYRAPWAAPDNQANVPSAFNSDSWGDNQGPGVPVPFHVLLPVSSGYPSMGGSHSPGYDMVVQPGLDGEEQGIAIYLARYEDRVVDFSTSAITFEWPQRDVTFDVREVADDQSTRIPGSWVRIMLWYGAPFAQERARNGVPSAYFGSYPSGDPGASVGVVVPFTTRLPVTVGYAGIFGLFSHKGYDISVVPGIDGVQQSLPANSAVLYRIEGWGTGADRHVDLNTTEMIFEWKVRDVNFDVRSNAGDPGTRIPGSTVRPEAGWARQLNQAGTPYAFTTRYPWGPGIPVPFTLRLPVSTGYPEMRGAYADYGYDVSILPGLGGSEAIGSCPGGYCGSSVLNRPEGGWWYGMKPCHVEFTTGDLVFEWAAHGCALAVADAGGTPVDGSTITLPEPFPAFTPGGTVLLPSTDAALYSPMYGAFANGYPITVTPGDTTKSGTFYFEVPAGGGFVPSSFVIDGRAYSLICASNRAPMADAGPNRAIASSEQSSTVLHGTGSDPDGDALTYRWREGETVLLDSTSIGSDAACDLNLGDLPALEVGTHELDLSVSDGKVSATSTTLLTIGNSPPAVVCGGGGTVQAGPSVDITGEIFDFDGNTLDVLWERDGTPVREAEETTSSGGAPRSLATLALTTGADGELALGDHQVRISVDDRQGGTGACTVEVRVIDTEAPTLNPIPSVSTLWPPDHKMHRVIIESHAADSSGGFPTLSVGVTSNEDPEKDGSGNTIPDWSEPVIDQQTGTITVDLRAERSGKGTGRTYTITLEAVDEAGNRSTAILTISAPHNRSNN